MRDELVVFLAGRHEWPPWDEFHGTGHGRLHEQVLLQGGTRLWAARLELAHLQGRSPKRNWTDERIRATLVLYLSGASEWPSPERFRADGFGQLRQAITRAGGVDRWAAEIGLPPPHRLRGKRVWWTEARIEAELRRFVAGHTVFPTQREFQAAGQGPLLSALRRHGGPNLWASKLEMPRRERYSGRVAMR